jgi:hypothetical protein
MNKDLGISATAYGNASSGHCPLQYCVGQPRPAA